MNYYINKTNRADFKEAVELVNEAMTNGNVDAGRRVQELR